MLKINYLLHKKFSLLLYIIFALCQGKFDAKLIQPKTLFICAFFWNCHFKCCENISNKMFLIKVFCLFLGCLEESYSCCHLKKGLSNKLQSLYTPSLND